MNAIITAENLHFTYGDGTKALRGINLELEQGKKIALMGANGSGKSTFFLCLNGINKPHQGQLYFHGKPVAYDRKSLLELRRKVGIVFQDPDNQLFAAGILQEISFGLLNAGVSREETKTYAQRIIQEMNMEAFRHKPTHALSGGQKKQVSIADILVMQPEVILMDEPFSALDPKHSRIVYQQIQQMSENGMTVLISTHDVDFASRWADQVVLFHDGKIVGHDGPHVIFRDADLLEKTHLTAPSSYRMFDHLCTLGHLSPQLPPPNDMEALQNYMTHGE